MILILIKLKFFNLIPKPVILEQHHPKRKIKLLLLNNNKSLTFNRNMSTNTKIVLKKESTYSNDLAFNQWLAGLIDGDGYFILTKKGYNSCEITIDSRDKKVLYLIQHKYGGSVKQISNANAFNIN